MAISAATEQGSGRAVRMEVEDGIAVVRINQSARPVNVLSNDLVDELAKTIQTLASPDAGVRGVVIVSDKPGVWIAGADIEELKGIQSAGDGESLSRRAHELLGQLEGLRVPVVAAIDGVALGGGLEVALACTYRIATDSPKTKLGLPEVQLGLLPGAGGTQRLPRLVGLRGALDMMLTGKQLDGRRARKLGLIDEVVPSAVLLQVAKQAASEIAAGKREPRAARPKGSPSWVENLPGLRAFIMKKARDTVLEKTRGLYPAPLRILQVVSRGLDRPLEEALALEATAFGELTVTPEARSLTHIFLTSTAAKNDPMLPEGAKASEVERVAIIGAGFMGSGIAVVSAESGMRVRMKDVSEEGVARGLKIARESLEKRAGRRRRPEHEVVALTDRLEGTTEYTGFGNADLVIEAVFEDVELKHRIIRDVEAAGSEETVIGSNTSTIPIGRLAEAASRPEKVIGLHFFSPVEKMPLLEIIVTPQTSHDVTATCHRWAKRIGKTPVIVNDGPGFYVNRILGPYMNEAALLLQEGAGIEKIDAAMVDWGFPVGPITLFDEVGLDVATKSGEILAEAFSDRVEPSEVLKKLIADGRLGRKNGRGFYLYEKGKKAGPDRSIYELLQVHARREVPEAEIQERLALGMINEAVRCLEDGVLRSARDGDVGAVFGIGFPPFRGGPFWYIDQVGAGRILKRLRQLEERFGARYAPAPLLVRKAEAGERFSEAS
jgi:3-hydroxyacyl-CoA dehydrogenase / enoyl-CoA hydratase / 3-hydroxybutyryl-CoA epimerase